MQINSVIECISSEDTYPWGGPSETNVGALWVVQDAVPLFLYFAFVVTSVIFLHVSVVAYFLGVMKAITTGLRNLEAILAAPKIAWSATQARSSFLIAHLTFRMHPTGLAVPIFQIIGIPTSKAHSGSTP